MIRAVRKGFERVLKIVDLEEETWGWLGSPRNAQRRSARLITLERPAAEAICLVTDLLDGERYPAADLLAGGSLYRLRWGIEEVFQQVTEVFHLQALIGTTPQGTVFQFAFCLLLYNLLQVVRQAQCPAALPRAILRLPKGGRARRFRWSYSLPMMSTAS